MLSITNRYEKGRNMNSLGIKYFSMAAVLMVSFYNAVACGSQFYRVSVHDDFDKEVAIRSNPALLDRSSQYYGIHTVEGWGGNVPINFRTDASLTREQFDALMRAKKRWEWAVGYQLFEYDGIDRRSGDAFADLYSSLNDNVNGHYLDQDWGKTGKQNFVLATTIWQNALDTNAIQTSDIRFNTEHYLIGDSLRLRARDNRQVVDMESLALHELGHLLGLGHVAEDVDPYSIMNPSLFIGEGLTSREISRGDIQRVQLIFGCEGLACNVDRLMAEGFSEESLSYTTLPQPSTTARTSRTNKTEQFASNEGKSGDDAK